MEPNKEDIRHMRYLTGNWRRPGSPNQGESWDRLVLLGMADRTPGAYPRWTLTEAGKALKLQHYDGLGYTAKPRA